MQMAAAYGAIANDGDLAPAAPCRPGRGRARVEAEAAPRPLRGDREAAHAHAARTSSRKAPERTRTSPATAWPARPVRPPKPDSSGGYSDTRYVASFVGFAPASRPEVVVLVTVDEPRGAIWGGTVAAPAFAEIAQFALQYLEVPPDDRRSADD